MGINLRDWFRKEARLLFPPQAFSGWDIASALWGHGEVRLIKNGANLQLNRYGAGLGRLIVGGEQVQISDAGPTLAPSFSGSAINTTYYIYCSTPSAPALEASTTAPVYDATFGIMVKTGDASRTLVGMARTITGPAWVDTERQRLVSSYFNRSPKPIYSPFSSVRSTESTSFVIANLATETVEFLSWDTATIGFCGTTNSGSGGVVKLYIDGVAVAGADGAMTSNNANIAGLVIAPRARSLEGFHTADIYFKWTVGQPFDISVSTLANIHGWVEG